MSMMDETSETIFITVQALNNSQIDSSQLVCNINQQTNRIVDDLSDYNIYLVSLTATVSNLPYFNIRKNIGLNPEVVGNQFSNNFLINQTNFTISLLGANGTTNFDLTGNTNLLVKGIGQQAGNKYQGLCVYLQYFSENSPLPNPANNNTNPALSTQNYPIEYFDIHSINQFVQMINNALWTIIGLWTTNKDASITKDSFYFYLNPDNSCYYLVMPNAFYTGTTNLYVNSFLERQLDAFRWKYYKASNMDDPNYDGLDYLFVLSNTPNNKDALPATGWTFPAVYSTITNIVDLHSVLIQANSGSLQNVRQQYVPIEFNNVQSGGTANSNNLPSISCLKNLDLVLDAFTATTLNNSFIQYESELLSFPINCTTNTTLTNITLELSLQFIDNTTRPLLLPAGQGYCNVKFALKKKVKDVKKK